MQYANPPTAAIGYSQQTAPGAQATPEQVASELSQNVSRMDDMIGRMRFVEQQLSALVGRLWGEGQTGEGGSKGLPPSVGMIYELRERLSSAEVELEQIESATARLSSLA